MDDWTVQILTTLLAVAGTLMAVVLTQRSNRLNERERRNAEDKARWLEERLRVGSAILAGSLKLERRLWDLCSMLDGHPRSERMPGHTSILLTPVDGIEGFFDEITRGILVEGVEEASERLNELEDLVAEMAILGSLEDATRARALHEELWVVTALLESYALFDEAADAVERCRTARDEFMKSMRTSLGVGDDFSPPDGRPRAGD